MVLCFLSSSAFWVTKTRGQANSAQTIEDRATSATGIINSLTSSGCLVLSQQPDRGQQGNTYCVDMRDGFWTQYPQFIYDEAVFWKPPKQEATVLRIGARVTVLYRSEGDRRIAISVTEEPTVERPWSQKPPTEWAMQEVIRTLVDSPWVHNVKLGASAASPMTGDFGPGGVGPGGIPRNQQQNNDDAVRSRLGLPSRRTPVEGTQPQSVGWTYGVSLRWLSSETLRTTLLRYWTLRGQPKHAAPMLVDHYAIGLKGPGAGSLSQIYLSSQKDALSHTPYLEFLPSKQKVFIRSVELVKQGALAPITDYMLYFPRTAEDGSEPDSGAEKARLFCEYEIGKRILPIKVEFDLRKMVRDGKPDL